MYRKRPQVLGVDLNRSESSRQPAPSEPRPILVQIRAPDERDVAGVIARGVYRYTDNMVRVWDTESQLLGTSPLRPGDDVEVAAKKKLLREKHSAGGFYGRINYPRSLLHRTKGPPLNLFGGPSPRPVAAVDSQAPIDEL